VLNDEMAQLTCHVTYTNLTDSLMDWNTNQY